jgi:hypothetical protein
MAHRRGLFFMIFLMVYFVVVNDLLAIFFSNFTFASSLWFLIFRQIAALLLPLAIWLAFFRENVNQHLPHIRLGTTNTIYIVGLSLLIFPVMAFISMVTSFFIPNVVSEFMLSRMEEPLWLLLLVVAVTPAICEEVVFRGYIQSAFKKIPFVTMALLNGLFFAIIHFGWSQFFYAFAAGIFFAYIVYATRSIRAAVISHFIINAINISLIWLTVNLSENFAAGLEQVEAMDSGDWQLIFTYVFIVVWAIGSAIGAGFLLYFFGKHNSERFASEEISEEPKIKLTLFDGVLILAIVLLYVIIVSG